MGDTPICDCRCHTGPYATCDVIGGCGSVGCDQHAEDPGCPTCAVYRPDKDPRDVQWPPICDPDRALLDRHHLEIGRLVAELSNDHADIADRRIYERFGLRYRIISDDGDQRVTVREIVSLGMVQADPVAALGGVAPINSRPASPSVTGSRERPIPISVAVLDLAGPAREPELSAAGWQHPDDQIGFLSAATILQAWSEHIRDALYPGHSLPPATVPDMIAWLRVRLPEVCDRYPGVADYAQSIKDLRGVLRSVAGETDPQPERCRQIACRQCDMETLWRQPDGDVHCTNAACRAVLRPDEYDEWVKQYAAKRGVKRHAARPT